jgi:hypothetical protein
MPRHVSPGVRYAKKCAMEVQNELHVHSQDEFLRDVNACIRRDKQDDAPLCSILGMAGLGVQGDTSVSAEYS